MLEPEFGFSSMLEPAHYSNIYFRACSSPLDARLFHTRCNTSYYSISIQKVGPCRCWYNSRAGITQERVLITHLRYLYESFVFFSHFWNLSIAESICFGLLSWIRPRICFNSSGIQRIRHRNSNSWKNHDANKQHGDIYLHSRNYRFVWVYILAIAENQ